MRASHWPAEELRAQIHPLLPGCAVEVAAECASTNTLLLERARAGHALPCLLVAERQTQGRGRLGRPWQSAAGASLTFSLALGFAPPDWQGLSLAVGVAMAQALDPAGGRVALKWPNDLWLLEAPGRGRKLAGVLIETVTVRAQSVCVIGIGLNVMPLPSAGLASGFACLREIDPEASAPRAWALLAPALVQALLRFSDAGFAAFAADFAQRDLLRGQRVSSTAPQAIEGVAEGVDETGALLVRAGRLHRLSSGEVSVRLVQALDAAGAP